MMTTRSTALRRWLPALAVFALAAGPAAAQTGLPFTPGNVVVYRIGNGTTALTSSAAQVYLDEYTFSGTRVQSILLDGLTAQGAGPGSQNQGRLNLSPDGQFLALTGYGAVPGAAVVGTSAAAVPRVVKIVNGLGQVQSTTSLTDAYSAPSGSTVASPFGAISSNGTDIWVIGQGGTAVAGTSGGLRYTTAGSSSSVRLADTSNFTGTRSDSVGIYNGQLYAADNLTNGSGNALGVVQVGTGLPTGGTPNLTSLGIGTNGQFVLADLDATTPGLDTAYTITSTNLRKFAKASNGSWFELGGDVPVPTTDTSGVSTVRLDLQGRPNTAGGYDLLLSTTGPSASAVYTLSDTNGYNVAISSTSFSQLFTSDVNTVFRGVEFVPVPEPGTVLGLSAAALGAVGLVRRRLRRPAEEAAVGG